MVSLSRSLVLPGACLLIVGCGGTKPLQLTWTEYKAPDQTFSVLFPANPEVKIDSGFHPAGNVETTTYLAVVDDATFIVERRKFPPKHIQEHGTGLLSDYATSDRRSGLKHLSDRNTTFDGHPAIEYECQDEFATPLRQLKGRLILVDNTIYDVALQAIPDRVTQEDATKFLDSFKLLGH